MRGIHVVNGLLAAGLIGFSLYAYPSLPDTIPLHFGADGAPDRWGERSLASWMILPVVGIVAVGITYLSALLVSVRPRYINMPQKDRLLKLPPEYQAWVLRGLARTLHVMSAVLLLMFCTLQYAAWLTAMGRDGSTMMQAGLVLALAGLPFVTIWMVVVTQRRLDEAVRRHRTGAPAPAQAD